jgi:hypothetical protein
MQRLAQWTHHPASHNEGDQCFEEDCRTSPYIMHFSSNKNTTEGGSAVCFKFVSVGCWASGGKGCCVEIARKLTRLEFDASKRLTAAMALLPTPAMTELPVCSCSVMGLWGASTPPRAQCNTCQGLGLGRCGFFCALQIRAAKALSATSPSMASRFRPQTLRTRMAMK